MRTYSTKKRINELKRWIRKNKGANYKDFMKEAGGTKSQFYYLRDLMKIGRKNMVLSQAMKEVAVNRKKPMTVVKEEPAAQQPFTPPKDEVVVEGTTPDFIWYEMDLMQRKLGDLSARIAHVMKVAQSRDLDQKKMMRNLIQENTQIRVENNNLKQQVAELTEMINGAPV